MDLVTVQVPFSDVHVIKTLYFVSEEKIVLPV